MLVEISQINDEPEEWRCALPHQAQRADASRREPRWAVLEDSGNQVFRDDGVYNLRSFFARSQVWHVERDDIRHVRRQSQFSLKNYPTRHPQIRYPFVPSVCRPHHPCDVKSRNVVQCSLLVSCFYFFTFHIYILLDIVRFRLCIFLHLFPLSFPIDHRIHPV